MKVRSCAVRGCGAGRAGGAVRCRSWRRCPQPAASQVYRCPGPPVLYTDALSPQEARDKGCRTIEGTPITIIQAPRPACRARHRRPATPGRAPAGRQQGRPGAQRQRDSDARRILLKS
jgi:hypothetical protein